MSRDFYILFFTFLQWTKMYSFLRFPVLLLRIPYRFIHLQHQGTHNFVQKNKSITENRADLNAYYKTNFNDLNAVADWIKLHHSWFA